MRGYTKPTVLLVDFKSDNVILTSSDVVIKETTIWDGHFGDAQGGGFGI